MQVMSWMSAPVHTVTPPTEVREAAALMRQNRIRHLPVMEGDRVVGVVTDRDVRGADPAARVSTIMSRPVVVVSPRTAIDKAARLLFERRIGCLPVIEDGKLVGILTQTDAVTALVDVVRLHVGGRASEVMVAYRPDAMALAHHAIRPLGVEVARLVVATLDPIGRGFRPERVRLQIESRDMPRVLDALRDVGLTVLATEPPKADNGRA